MEDDRVVKIYTRRGDQGETGLFYGDRVSKTDPRCEAYGTIDEAVSALGLARALSQSKRVKDILKQMQRELFTVGGELATDPKEHSKLESHLGVVTAEMVARLEEVMDDLNEEISLPRAFIVPGASPASSALDLARSILRRAERRVVHLKEEGMVRNIEVLRYLNRLADLIFLLARYEDKGTTFDVLTGDG